MQEYILSLPDEAATFTIGRSLAKACDNATLIYLYGDIGTGKSSFCRSFIQALGYRGQVKSPTYTLVEQYVMYPLTVFHFDLYRLFNPIELEFIGIRDYFIQDTICLVEWAQNGIGVLPEEDLALYLSYHNHGRMVKIQPMTTYGSQLLEYIQRQ